MATTTFESLLSKYPAEVRALAAGARTFIREILAKAEESLDEAAGVVGYGYGAGYKGLIWLEGVGRGPADHGSMTSCRASIW